ncbi:PKD domain-containing protein [Peredibacter sp. HCB2-198]|uniref:PKD domain-containing protein n=1 Tax=Peredibacter sp. HCB2-198 TaxID=3383025 RepID=UPI0038B60D11
MRTSIFLLIFTLFLSSCQRSAGPIEEINIIDLVTSSIFAGHDKVITTSKTTLEALATDIQSSSYRWTKISGGPAKIEKPHALSTKITGLRPGKYVFRITKKEEGLTLTDEVSITVRGRS